MPDLLDSAAVPTVMRALTLADPTRPGEMQVELVTTPAPGTGDVLVRVHAASFTPGELDWPSTWIDRAGHDRTPSIPSHEFSGVVAGLGHGVSTLAIGDEVFGLTDWYRDGAAAEYLTVQARDVAPKPRHLSHVQAATLALAGLTAWQGLLEIGELSPDQRVLILGAAGGVGSVAVQVAKSAGAWVVGADLADHRAAVLALGADDYCGLPAPTLDELAPLDLIFDAVGGDPLRQVAARLRPTGAVVSIIEDPSPAAPRHPRSRFFVVEPDREGLRNLARLADSGSLSPVVSSTSALELAADAIAHKQSGQVRGKIAFDLTVPA